MLSNFLSSFALFDSSHRLVDWDAGFVQEFLLAGLTLRHGMTYAELLRTATAAPAARQSFTEQSGDGDPEALIQARLDGFGEERCSEYRALTGRIMRIDEQPTISGGVRRLTRDVTEERNAGTALLKATGTALLQAKRRQDEEDSDRNNAPIEISRDPDGVYHVPPITDAICRLLGLSPEMVGADAMVLHARMIAEPGQDIGFGVLMEQSAEALSICSFEYKLHDGKNRLRWIRQSMMPRREADGTVLFSGAMRDITREKEAEDQVELLRSVVVRSSDSIAIFETQTVPERQTKTLYVNAKFIDLFGGCADSLVGKPIQAMSANNLNAQSQAMMAEAVRRNDGVSFECETAGRGGRVFWVEIRVMTVQTLANGSFRWVAISRDITERRHAHDQLRSAKEQAEASNRAKSDFMANMSHELRTPLNAIIGFTELIEHGVAKAGWQSSYAEYLADVSSSGRHLLDLINTILDLSKIEAGQVELDVGPVDLCALTRTSLALVAGMARDSRITISTDIPRECSNIPGDFMKLKQVLLNILSNAIKFTPVEGKIAVRVNFTATQAAIVVSDTGCGIKQADLERVMLPFAQVENSLSRKYGGSGLGLPIARQLCGLHGGRLIIRSVEGRGTTVRILLPRSPLPDRAVRSSGNPVRSVRTNAFDTHAVAA